MNSANNFIMTEKENNIWLYFGSLMQHLIWQIAQSARQSTKQLEE